MTVVRSYAVFTMAVRAILSRKQIISGWRH